MFRVLALVLALLVGALPAAAQTTQPVLQAPAPASTEARLPNISAGHALALGAGMFAGAVLGSAMINSGSFAAAIGAAAGITFGHWYWTQHRREFE